jgi:hypothetical protein
LLATLEGPEEQLVVSLLSLPAPAAPRQIARESWEAMLRAERVRHREALEARLRQPGLPLAEVLQIQREIQGLAGHSRA